MVRRSGYSKCGYVAVGTVTVGFKLPLDESTIEELDSIEDDEEKEERLYEAIGETLAGMWDADDCVESDRIKIEKDYTENGVRIIEGIADVHATVRVSAYDREDAYEAADESVFNNESIITEICDSDWSIDEDEPDWEQDD